MSFYNVLKQQVLVLAMAAVVFPADSRDLGEAALLWNPLALIVLTGDNVPAGQ